MRSFTERVKGVTVVELVWELSPGPEELAIVRYCSGCKDKVLFGDSLKRRRNANGKNIFEYAVYRCEKGHTWNKPLAAYKASEYEDPPVVTARQELAPERVCVAALRERGVSGVSIALKAVEGRWRLDKLLAKQFEDLSRTQIETMIRQGAITLDDATVKPGVAVKAEQRIRIDLTPSRSG